MSGFDGMGGAENHGGVPIPGQGYYAAVGRGGEIADELRRPRRPRRPRGPRRRWWQLWRRANRPEA